jgi:hypothetical protein
MAFSTMAFAQDKTETFKVNGVCGMCKSKIEKAAKEAGVKTASWDEDTKDLTVTYNTKSTNTAKIQKKIAGVGYDNAGAKATDESYNKLHDCCKYDRANFVTAESCCAAGADCCKDGKCTKHDKESCCAPGADCCKDGKCTKHDAKESCCASGSDCCKDGKCTKEGHTDKKSKD